MSNEEKIEFAKKEKIIVRENTRFKSNPWKLTEAQKTILSRLKKKLNWAKLELTEKIWLRVMLLLV